MRAGPTIEFAVSLAIPTYGRDGVLVETLRQAFECEPAPSEIIVVDQTPEHDGPTTRFLEDAAARESIRWIRQAEPNLPRARNRALAEAKGDLVIFIDDDVILPRGFVGEHARNYTDPLVAAVAGRVIRKYAWGARKPPRAWPRELDYRFFSPDRTDRVVGVANFSGGNHSARVAVLRAVGGYDERYIGWAFREDSDAAMRLWKQGHLIVFDPLAELEHLAAPAGGCRVSGEKRAEWSISYPALYFVSRHFFPRWNFWFEAVLGVRRYVFRRTNVFRPWRLPLAAAAYLYAFGKAFVDSRRTPGATLT